MANWKQHLIYVFVFILVYIIFKLYIPQFFLLASLFIAFFIAIYVTRNVITEDWIAKVVRFILGKDF
jgi:hypothetical protein